LLLLTGLVFAQAPPQAPAQDSPPQSAADSNSQAINSQAIPSDPESTRKARALIDQAIEALGGQAYLNVHDFTQQGRSYSFHRGESNSAGIVFTRFRKLWDKDRVEYTAKREFFNLGGIPMTEKAHVITIFNGDKAFEVTSKGIGDVDPKDVVSYMRRRHFALDLVLRDWLQQPGVALFYEGHTVAAQKETEQVTVMNHANEAVTLFFDVNTHLPVKKSFTWRDPADKQRNVEEEIFDNYRPIQGVMTPFDTVRFFNGEMSYQAFLTSVRYNQGTSDDVFDPKIVSSSIKH
jgi:hypothetical protein